MTSSAAGESTPAFRLPGMTRQGSVMPDNTASPPDGRVLGGVRLVTRARS